MRVVFHGWGATQAPPNESAPPLGHVTPPPLLIGPGVGTRPRAANPRLATIYAVTGA